MEKNITQKISDLTMGERKELFKLFLEYVENFKNDSISYSFTDKVCFLSESILYQECIEEWAVYLKPNTDLRCNEICVCDRDENIFFPIFNLINENIINICFSCFKNFSSLKYNELIYIKKEDMRQCGSCLENKIENNSPFWMERCKECYDKGLPILDEFKLNYYRECSECKEKSISQRKSKNVKLCGECYEISKNIMRECLTCGLQNIPITFPAYKKECINCYSEGEKRECESCGEKRIPISKPERIKLCYSCYGKK